MKPMPLISAVGGDATSGCAFPNIILELSKTFDCYLLESLLHFCRRAAHAIVDARQQLYISNNLSYPNITIIKYS